MPEGKTRVSNFCESARKYALVTGSVTTWQSFAWDLGLSAREMVAIVLHRIETDYYFHMLRLDDVSECIIALSGRDLGGAAYAAAHLTDTSLYAFTDRKAHMLSAGGYVEDVVVQDFSGLPGGGLILPARPLYTLALADNLGTNMGIVQSIWFDVVELDQANMLDLVQTMYGYPT